MLPAAEARGSCRAAAAAAPAKSLACETSASRRGGAAELSAWLAASGTFCHAGRGGARSSPSCSSSRDDFRGRRRPRWQLQKKIAAAFEHCSAPGGCVLRRKPNLHRSQAAYVTGAACAACCAAQGLGDNGAEALCAAQGRKRSADLSFSARPRGNAAGWAGCWVLSRK